MQCQAQVYQACVYWDNANNATCIELISIVTSASLDDKITIPKFQGFQWWFNLTVRKV